MSNPPAAPSAADSTHLHRIALTRNPHATLPHRHLGTPVDNHKPFPIPMSLYAENRAKLCARLREAATHTNMVVLMEGGKEEYRHESDTEKLFRQESSFMYLFGVKEPGFYASIDVATGSTTLYMPRLPAEYAVWMGTIQPPSYFKDLYQVDRVVYVDELAATLKAYTHPHTATTSNGNGNGNGTTALASLPLLLLNKGLNTDSGNEATPAQFQGIDSFPCNHDLLYPNLVECRVLKSPTEVQILQYANNISSDAHFKVMQQVKPGLSEYQLEALFLHHGYYYGGGRHVAYTSICGCGPNAATLHYGHAGAPNDREIQDGDMLLLDMGAEYHCYASDITCSFPANGRFTEDQKMIFNCVKEMQFAVMDALRPGVCWKDMHELAYRVGCTELKKGGLLLGEIDEMMEKNIMSFFMPHGLGHFMGLDVHDCGGYAPHLKLERDTRAGYKSLRTVRVMEAGMVITVEPGVYFIDVLLDQLVGEGSELKQYVDVNVLKRFRGFGGVRLEDDVVITEGGIRNLTHCPRTVEEVEGVISGKITDKTQLFKKY